MTRDTSRRFACILVAIWCILVHTGCAPATAVVRVRVYHSQPARPPTDTSVFRDAGPVAAAALVALFADPVVAGIIVGGGVARRAVERVTDAEFKTTDVDVPIVGAGAVVITLSSDGQVQIVRLPQDPVAPAGYPIDSLDLLAPDGVTRAWEQDLSR